MTERSSQSGSYMRAALSIASAVILTFFAMQIYFDHKVTLVYKIVSIVVIAVVGVAGIIALLTPVPDEVPPAERLYTEGEVAALVAAVHAGRLVPAQAVDCKFCHGPQPDTTGLDGSRYHQSCFRAAYQSGKT